MIARFGANELNAVINYLGIKNKQHSIYKYITGKQNEWWWNKGVISNMQNNAGFFPATSDNMQRFGELMLEDAKEVDILCSWQKGEYYLNGYIPQRVIRVNREKSNPFFAATPWTKALAGRKVLVVHPFAKTIMEQYARRELLFANKNILPEFGSLQVIKAVQSLGGKADVFNDWFEALDWMKAEIDKCDYDVCLIGCGAYGFPLAAHVKRQGHQAVHIGGVLQLYFGIKGKRWEGKGYVGTDHDYSTLFNQYWVRPSLDETPKNSTDVESGCYW